MNIGIDARFLGPEGTGIGRYVEKLIENLEELDQENNYFIFLRKSNYHLYSPKNPRFQKVVANARWYSLKEQVIMPAVLNKYNLDLVHFPHAYIPLLYKGKFVTTTHDLTKINFKEKAATTHLLPIYLAKHLAFTIAFKQALARSIKIITPSQYVKNELVKKMDVSKNKITVTYEGADNFLEKDENVSEGKIKEIFNQYSIKNPFILYVGNTYPHKNLDTLLEAMPKVTGDVKLVCVTGRGVFMERLTQKAENLGVRSRLILTGSLTDSDLRVLFNQALALVFPSLSEGFGLPGLEAMAQNCPVICSNITSLPEVYGDAAIYFDPHSSTDIAEKINNLIANEKLRKELITKGRQQVKKYSWEKMAKETLEVYKEVLSSK